MTLVLTEDQEMLRDAAAGFLADNAPVSEFRKLRDEANVDGFDRDLWAEIAQMGWAGILVPEEHGGADFDMVGAGLIAEEMGKNLTASPYLATAIMAATAMNKVASEKQAAAHLPDIASGKKLYAVAIDEASKHNPAKTMLKAERPINVDVFFPSPLVSVRHRRRRIRRRGSMTFSQSTWIQRTGIMDCCFAGFSGVFLRILIMLAFSEKG